MWIPQVIFTIGFLMLMAVFQLGGVHPASPWLFVVGLVMLGMGWNEILDARIRERKAQEAKKDDD